MTLSFEPIRTSTGSIAVNRPASQRAMALGMSGLALGTGELDAFIPARTGGSVEPLTWPVTIRVPLSQRGKPEGGLRETRHQFFSRVGFDEIV